jgi:hypothetical protein
VLLRGDADPVRDVRLLELLCWLGLIALVTTAAVAFVDAVDAPIDETERPLPPPPSR